MSIELIHFNHLKTGEAYSKIYLKNKLLFMYDVGNYVSITNVKTTMYLGNYKTYQLHGRSYDPDVTLLFVDENSNNINFELIFNDPWFIKQNV